MSQIGAVVPKQAVLPAEPPAADEQQCVALGRYLIEMRHGFNNAMTSLLGNAELLLQKRDSLPPRVCEQLQIIQTMALRLHRMMQAVDSIETELPIREG